jgi:hypothetical protein
MSENEYEELLTFFQRAHELIQEGLYEEALNHLERCEYLASKFTKSHLLYETKRLISICKLLQGKFEEFIHERELAAEEIERLGGYDEAGEVYKELADLLLVTDKFHLAKKYYFLADLNFNRWAESYEDDASRREAWKAWALVCRGQAQSSSDKRISNFTEASQKFAQASLQKVKFKNFYQGRELFLKGRIAILKYCINPVSFDKKGLQIAERLFAQACALDPSFLLAKTCVKIFRGLRLLEKSENKAKKLFEEAKILLKEFKNLGLSHKLSSLLCSFQFIWDKQNLSSFCKGIEEILII